MSDPTPDIYQLPLATNLIIFAFTLSISSMVALWMVHYYARKGLSLVCRITVLLSYIAAFMALYVTWMDVTGGYKGELKYIWKIYYILVSVGCWIIVPFQQAYHDNGGFTFKDKALHSLKDEGTYYGIVFLVAGSILGYIYITTTLTFDDVFALVLALANTFGFILLTLFFGSGLVNLPLTVWGFANRASGAQFCLYKLGKLNEKMQIEQDRLQQTNQYIELLAQNCNPLFTDLLDIIRSKLPPPTSYEFAFIGSSSGTEAHGELERLQKHSFNLLQRKHYIALHYIVINHRRSLAMFQTEWKDTIDRYLYLNQLASLRQKYPKSSQLPSDSFIAPGEQTYSNFPGSVMWTLPCCCGERDDATTASTMFAQDMASRDGANLDDLAISINSPHASGNNSTNSSNTPQDVVQRTSSMLNAGYENSGASTMDSNNDIYDDMTSRHTSNLGTLGLKYQKPPGTTFAGWLFRKAPALVPGTMYYRFTWLWYKFVVYFQPWLFRCTSIVLWAISAVLMWSEVAIIISHKLAPMYYLTHANVGPFWLSTFRLLPLCYVVVCIYYTIFNINLGWWFHMQPQHRTAEHSMLFSCSLMLRTIFTTTFNYYQMCGVQNTAFLDFTGQMTVIPLLGKSFNYIMPLFVALFAILTLVNCWAWFLKLLGVPHFSFSMRSAASEQFVADGTLLIDRHQRRIKGERVEHFRSKEIEGAQLKANRQAKKNADGTAYVAKPKRESAALKAIKEREEREAAEKQALADAERAQYNNTTSTTNSNNNNSNNNNNWNSKPMPNKFNKYHSQNQPKQNLNDW